MAFCVFWFMEPAPKLTKYTNLVLRERLNVFWKVLKSHFAPQAEDDVARAEEQRRGRNEPEGVR